MKQDRQPNYRVCERCKGRAPVVRTSTAHEFYFQCACGSAGWISWANHNPPPLYDAPAQAGLDFGEVNALVPESPYVNKA